MVSSGLSSAIPTIEVRLTFFHVLLRRFVGSGDPKVVAGAALAQFPLLLPAVVEETGGVLAAAAVAVVDIAHFQLSERPSV